MSLDRLATHVVSIHGAVLFDDTTIAYYTL